MKEIIINKNDCGQRLDKFIFKAAPSIPKALLYKYIRLKRIKVNGKRCRNSDILNEKDVVSLYINDEFFEYSKNNLELVKNIINISVSPEIVYEDENIIVVYKPEGMDVHRGSEKAKATLIDIIKAYLYRNGEYDPEKENSFSPAVCNRLDRNTTGLVIAAKNAASLREINEFIRERKIIKKYLCICAGIFPANHGIETAYHKKGQHNLVNIRKSMADGYKQIVTEYKIMEVKGNFALAEINLITGRTHQIRAHLAFIGAPILGDGKYGNVTVNKRYGIYRQQLCAYSIEFDIDSDCRLGYLAGKKFFAPKAGFTFGGFSIK